MNRLGREPRRYRQNPCKSAILCCRFRRQIRATQLTLAANSHQPRRTHVHQPPRRDLALLRTRCDRDIDSIVNLFADVATVIDEGEERHGKAEIRAWQTGAASKYTYTTEITSAEAPSPDRCVVTGRLTGNFPRGTADLKWEFTIAGQHITRLIIAP